MLSCFIRSNTNLSIISYFTENAEWLSKKIDSLKISKWFFILKYYDISRVFCPVFRHDDTASECDYVIVVAYDNVIGDRSFTPQPMELNHNLKGRCIRGGILRPFQQNDSTNSMRYRIGSGKYTNGAGRIALLYDLEIPLTDVKTRGIHVALWRTRV